MGQEGREDGGRCWGTVSEEQNAHGARNRGGAIWRPHKHKQDTQLGETNNISRDESVVGEKRPRDKIQQNAIWIIVAP